MSAPRSLPRPSLLFAVTLSLLAVSLAGGMAAENWPEFRGPHGNGAAEGDPPTEWSETQNILWKTPIDGLGWSSPVVWGDRIWLTTADPDGKRMFVVCVDRQTGRVLHNKLVFENENPRFRHPTNSYASCTPALEENAVYVHFGSYGTARIDPQSCEIVWARRDLPCNHWRAPGSSPIIDGDALFVAYDGYDLQYIVALNKHTGETLWKRDRNIDYGTDNGDRKKAYSTAQVIEHQGRRQLISPSAMETISYDPSSGEELWRVKHGGMNAAVRPIFGNGLVYIAAGDGAKGMVAVRPDGDGDVTRSHIAWSLGKSIPKRPSQLLAGDLLFMIDDKSVASCIDAKSGEILWQKRIGGGEYRSSPVLVGDRIYAFSTEGAARVLAAGRRFKLIAENELANGFQASPAVVGDTLIVRSTKHLYCIGEK